MSSSSNDASVASLSVRLAARMTGVSESATLRLNAAVQTLRARGEDVINLSTGEPDFQPPHAAREAVLEAVRAGKSKYTAAAGIPELRQLIADRTNRQQPSVVQTAGCAWRGSDVVVTNGGKQALFQALMALVDAGDEVLIPAPYWLSYPEMTKLVGGVPRFLTLPESERFKLTPEVLESALKAAGKRARVLLLNSPSNPTGATLGRAELQALGKVIEAAIRKDCPDLWVISDEIYDRVLFTEEPFCSFLEACPSLRDRTITVNGLSKSAAMTGWRLGWAVAPTPVKEAIETLQGQISSGVNALSQAAACAALRLSEDEFRPWTESYRRRRQLVQEILGQAPGLRWVKPDGAFYFFLGVSGWLRPGESTLALAERILESAKVAVVPGDPFGAPGWVRITFATDDESLRKACERLVAFGKANQGS